MSYREILNIAFSIAIKTHAGQLDKQGKPYINHAHKVAGRCKTLPAKIVGFLHDALEDCPEWTPGRLIDRGIPKSLVDVVVILTHLKNETYDAYIERVKTHPVAIEVKLSDLKHNMDWTRNKVGITTKDVERTIKYHRAYVELYNCLDKEDEE